MNIIKDRKVLLFLATLLVVVTGLVLLVPRHKEIVATPSSTLKPISVGVANPNDIHDPSQNSDNAYIDQPGVKPVKIGTDAQPSVITQDAAKPVDIRSYETKVIQQINLERAKVSLQPLKLDVRLTDCAYRRTHEMNDGNWFGHYAPGSNTLADQKLITSCVPEYKLVAEVLDTNDPTYVVNNWLASPDHHDILLDGRLTHIGFAFSTAGATHKYLDTESNQYFDVNGINCAILTKE